MTGSISEVSSASSWRLLSRRHRPAMISDSDTGGLLVGSGSGAPGQGEEHVVERGGMHGEAPHRRALRVELVEHGPNVRRRPVGGDADGQAARITGDRAVAGEAGLAARPRGAGPQPVPALARPPPPD